MKSGRLYSPVTKYLLIAVLVGLAIYVVGAVYGTLLRASPPPLREGINDVALLLAGFIYVLIGADLVVRGGVALARRFRIRPAVVGLTVVSLASTAPELVIVASATSSGHADLAVGNVVGCNIANLFLVVGLPALIYRVDCGGLHARLMGPVLLGVSVLFGILCLAGPLGPVDGLFLVTGAVLMLGAALLSDGSRRASEVVETPLQPWPLGLPSRLPLMVVFIGMGALLLPAGAEIMVQEAESLASWLSVPETVVAVTVVSLGTSLPELATAVTAAVQRRTDLAVGNILGSSVLNLLLVMGVGALVAVDRIAVPLSFVIEHVSVMIVGALILAVFTLRRGSIGPAVGAILVPGYVAYIPSQVVRA